MSSYKYGGNTGYLVSKFYTVALQKSISVNLFKFAVEKGVRLASFPGPLHVVLLS